MQTLCFALGATDVVRAFARSSIRSGYRSASHKEKAGTDAWPCRMEMMYHYHLVEKKSGGTFKDYRLVEGVCL